MPMFYDSDMPRGDSVDRAFDLSVVIPVYNGAGTIEQVVQGVRRAFGSRGTLQIVLVDDGSLDASHEACRSLASAGPESVSYLRLAKNFGEHNAVMAGLRLSRGGYVVIMDDDMQNLPEDAVRLYEEAKAKDFDVVYAVYPRKMHSFFRNLGSGFNGLVANLLLDKPKDLYLCSFKAMSARLVREMIKYDGPAPYIDGLALRCTRNIGRLEVSHHERSRGQSGYTLRKLVRLWLNMFVNFSVMPLRLSTGLGFLAVLAALVLMVSIVIEKLVSHATPPGFAYIAIIIMGFAGAQLMMLGLIGEYLGRLFLAQNQTPQYVVRESFGLGAERPPSA